MVQTVPDDSADEAENWAVHADPTAVAAALDARGIQEGPLKKKILALQTAGKCLCHC